MLRGKYIVIEGPTSVGKSTHIKKLGERLKLAGLPVRYFSDSHSPTDITSKSINSLSGDPRYPMNNRTETLLFNAIRSQSLEEINSCLDNGIICLSDHNYLSSLAEAYYGQGNIPDYSTINQVIEFAINGLQPDLTIILDAPVNILLERLNQRLDNTYNEAYLDRIRAGYLWEAHQRQFQIVYALDDSDKVSDEIWKLTAKTLATRSNNLASSSEPSSIKEIIAEKPELKPLIIAPVEAITPASDDISSYISSTNDQVYTLKPGPNPFVISNTLKQLSLRGGEFKSVLSSQLSSDKNSLTKSVDNSDDHSLLNYYSHYLVVEEVSQLGVSKFLSAKGLNIIEPNPLGSDYDKKDGEGNYNYLVPKKLDPKTRKSYLNSLNNSFRLYKEIYTDLVKYLEQVSETPKINRNNDWSDRIKTQAINTALNVLPIVLKQTIVACGTSYNLNELIMSLQSDQLAELNQVGNKALAVMNKYDPIFAELDSPIKRESSVAYTSESISKVSALAQKYLDSNYASETEEVKLVNHQPKSELDLVSNMLYEYSNQPLETIKSEVNSWTINKKIDVYVSYVNKRRSQHDLPSKALENAQYNFEVVSDYQTFREVQKLDISEDISWQALNPRYGYDIPQLIDDALLTEMFEESFNISLELYSLMQQAGFELEAQYATLMGHKMRWQIRLNALQLIQLLDMLKTLSENSKLYLLISKFKDKLDDTAPILLNSIKIANNQTKTK